MYSVFAALQNLLSRSLRPADRGATAVEYALITAIITVAIIVALKALGTQVKVLFNTVATDVANAL